MLILKNALVTLSLGATILVPNAALACAPHSHPAVKHETKHDLDDKDHKSVAKSDEHKDVDHKVYVVHQDNDDKKVEDHKDVKEVKDQDKPKSEGKRVCKPKPVVTPAPTVTPQPGKGSVLATIAPAPAAPAAVTTATTLPATGGNGAGIALAAAGASALAAYQIAKRRRA